MLALKERHRAEEALEAQCQKERGVAKLLACRKVITPVADEESVAPEFNVRAQIDRFIL